MSKLIDLTGRRFGRLVVLKRAGNYIQPPNGRKRPQWLCKCDCGNVTTTIGENLRNGSTVSCGCRRKENGAKSLKGNHYQRTHGKTNTRLYNIWCNMKSRCRNPNNDAFRLYGAEGKTVCEEWQEFKPFYDWSMSHGYRDDLTIDRTDGTKGYSPENCRWATMKEQQNNRRNNRKIPYNGEEKTIPQWADEYNINVGTLRSRLERSGWTIEKALTP